MNKAGPSEWNTRSWKSTFEVSGHINQVIGAHNEWLLMIIMANDIRGWMESTFSWQFSYSWGNPSTRKTDLTEDRRYSTNTEDAEKMYKHFKQRKNYVIITKMNSHKQKMMSTNHLRLLQLQQLLKMPTMGVGTLLSTLNYCSSNVYKSVLVLSDCSTCCMGGSPGDISENLVT